MDEALAEAIRRALGSGAHGALGLRTENCQKTFAELTAKGVEFIQPPAERRYDTEAIIRDNSGNWLVLVEQKHFRPRTSPRTRPVVPDEPGRRGRERNQAVACAATHSSMNLRSLFSTRWCSCSASGSMAPPTSGTLTCTVPTTSISEPSAVERIS